MESSESHEPSYYEVALTNRQVLIAFVVLLTSIVAAFLSGVWIGRGGSSPARPTAGIIEASTATDPPLEQLTFFNGKEAGERGAATGTTAGTGAKGAAEPASPKPASSVVSRMEGTTAPNAVAAAEESATEAMRQNLDATMAANRTVPPGVTPDAAAPAGTRGPAQSSPTTQPAPSRPAPTKPATTQPATTKPAIAGRIFVQVYSSGNAARAREIVAQLRKAGFGVLVAESPKGGGTNHRVRVGPYAERAKADAAAVRLRREFRLETWVTDSP